MRPFHFLAALGTVAIGMVAASCGEVAPAIVLCDPGSNVFCRCRDGTAGTKRCSDEGTGFAVCETIDGACEELSGIEPDGGGGKGAGVPTPAPAGELLGPCAQDADCHDGMVCPMGYCTKPCQSYDECGDGDCVEWSGVGSSGAPLCMPYCIIQDHCAAYGAASRCGYTDRAVPAFDVVVCADWGEALALPPDGFPQVGDCGDDPICSLGLPGVERVCGPSGCTDGCHQDADCSEATEACSSPDGQELGSCGAGASPNDGDDCPGIPLSLSMASPDALVQGNTANAPPPEEHAVAAPCYASTTAPNEEQIYAVSIGSDTACNPPGGCQLSVSFTTSSPSYDAQLYARHSSCAGGGQLACSDAIGGGKPEAISFTVFAGETIWVFVDGWQSVGAYQLALQLTP